MRNSCSVLAAVLLVTALPRLPVRAAAEDVIINEIHYHPPSDCEGEEFVELYNRGPDAVDLGGWSFLEGVPFTFPAGTALGSHEYLVVARDPDALQARFATIARLYGPWGAWPGIDHPASLADDGEDIVLADASGTPVNRVEFDDKTPWPVSPDGEGPSLELVCPDLPNGEAGAWRAAGMAGTSRWTFYQTSGPAFSTTFLVRLSQQGVWYIDDVELRPEGGGDNLVSNGGFETDGGWTSDGNHAGSGRVTEGPHGGQACLRIVASAPGDAVNAVRQAISGLALDGSRYTLSFWAKGPQGGARLTAGLAGAPAVFDAGESIPPDLKQGGTASFDAESGTYSIQGTGYGFEPWDDQLFFLHGALPGDGVIEAVVGWTGAKEDQAKAGLMIRETDAPDSPCVLVVLGGNSGVWMQHRTAPGDQLVSDPGPVASGPVRLRLERQGDNFIASADTGGGMVPFQQADIRLSDPALIGLVVASNETFLSASADFSSVYRDVLPLEVSTPAGSGPVSMATPGAPNTVLAARTPPSIRKVEHHPRSPGSSDAVTVRAKVDCLDGTPVTSVTLEYQVVAPGRYVRISDAGYGLGWTAVALHDDGLNGDEAAGDSVWTAVLPAQPNRTLVRYRIAASDAAGGSSRLPYPEDPSPNFAWFVHDGIPDYVADRKSFQGPVPQVHSGDALAALPVYQLITDSTDFQACVDDPGISEDNVFRWRGTLVSGGEVHDHIRYRLRGAATRFLEKKSFKFKLNHGSRLERTDDFGRADPVKRSVLHLNSVFQLPGPGEKEGLPSISPRGECGIYDTLGYSLFRWMGIPAPLTSWVQLRVVRGEEEQGADQYQGDFFGLYLDVEDPDFRFLAENGLPEGNLYKIESGWNKEAGTCDPADDADIRAFSAVLPVQPPKEGSVAVDAAWLAANVDLDEYYSYLTVVQMAAHQDIGSHNCYYFHHPVSGRWMKLPWDVNLTFAWAQPNMIGVHDEWTGSILDGHADFDVDFKNRLREGVDLLFREDKLFPIIDGWAALIAPLAAADRDRWDDGTLHTPYGPLAQRVAELKFWIGQHRQVVADYTTDTIPSTPQVLTPAKGSRLAADSLAFTSSPFAGAAGRAHAASRWIATRVSAAGTPRSLEVLLAENELAPRWDSGPLSESKTSARIPPGGIDAEAGAVYRVRVRYLDDAGRWSHWSEPVDVEIAPDSTVRFARADATGDGQVDITDAVAVLSYLFLGGGNLDCRKAGDANDDGKLDLTDAVSTLEYLFLGGSPPPPPFPACGDDPTADDLPCVSYTCR